MKIAIGCDHAATEYKSALKERLSAEGHEIIDAGIQHGEKADYPDIAAAVARLVVSGTAERGILICGTGIGMSMAANKIDGVRAAAVSDHFSARMMRTHNDANILCMGQRVIGLEVAYELAEAFVNTAFEGGRHTMRVDKITALEKGGHV